MVIINTMKFKAINEPLKKTDKYVEEIIAELLPKDMLTESRLWSGMSEQLQRFSKARETMVKA